MKHGFLISAFCFPNFCFSSAGFSLRLPAGDIAQIEFEPQSREDTKGKTKHLRASVPPWQKHFGRGSEREFAHSTPDSQSRLTPVATGQCQKRRFGHG
jgi:hypothetical protein